MKKKQNHIRTALTVFILADTLLFILGSMARMGLSIPWKESENYGAVIAQSTAVLMLFITLIVIWAGKPWVSWLSWVALLFSFLGILMGMIMVANGVALQTKPTAYLTIGMVFFTTGALVLRALWHR